MTDRLTIAIAQLNPTVGDMRGNIAKLRQAREEAERQGADLVIASELSVAGYPPEDLVTKGDFVAACAAAVAELARETVQGPAIVVGTPWVEAGRRYNAAALLDGGKVAALRFKHDRRSDGVFDEKRVFAAGPAPGPIAFRGVRLGVMVGGDMGSEDATETLEESGAELLLVLDGSPFASGRRDERLSCAVARVTESGLPLLYVNQVGGQDERVFDGGSFALDADCSLRVQAPMWREAVIATRWRRGADDAWTVEPGAMERPDEGLAAIYQALVLGLRDFVRKNRFPGVVLGLSGDVASALTAAVAVDALGPARVHCVRMPSHHDAAASREDAAAVAAALGCTLDGIEIDGATAAFAAMLGPAVAGRAADAAQATVEAGIRGATLMALADRFGWLALATADKSALAVGSAALGGDMCGGFAVLKDVYKTTLGALARWRNAERPMGLLGPAGPVIPDRLVAMPPSAERRPGATGAETLPPDAALDDILMCIVERDMALEAIVERGHAAEIVRGVSRMLDRAEHKRRQAPPGVTVSRRAFGRDRRYPITNAFDAAPPLPAAEPGETSRPEDPPPVRA